MANNLLNIGTSIITTVLSDKVSKSTKGSIGSVRAVTNPQGVLNQVVYKANKKLPDYVRNNEAIRGVETTVVNSVSKGIQSVFQSKNGVITVNFSNLGNVFQNIFNGIFNSCSSYNCGFLGDINRSVPNNQLIVITSTSESSSGTITAKLQKSVSLYVEGTWKSFIEQNSKFEEANMWIQGVSGAFGKQFSLINAASARRMWMGTSPLKMNIELYFMSVTDTFREVVEPCMRLQRMALPELINDNKFGLLSPPGPIPTTLNVSSGFQGDIITISIGNFLSFSPVIIKSVNVDFDNKLDVDGYPISAKATVEFETFQIITKQDLTKAVSGMPGTSSQSVTSSVNQSTSSIKDVAESLSVVEELLN